MTSLAQTARALPIWALRDPLRTAWRQHDRLVLIAPTGAIGLINNGAWGEIVLQAEINADVTTGVFGRVAWDTGGALQAYP